MPFRRPRFPISLSRGHVLSKFRKIRQRELGDTVSKICIELETLYRSVPWMKVEKLRELSRMKNIRNFSKDKAQELLDNAQEVINEHCEQLSECCFETRDKLMEILDGLDEADEATQELLNMLSEQADEFGNETAKESIEEKLAEYHGEFFSHMDGISEKRFDGLKKGFVQIVDGIKEVIEVDFNASIESAKINKALTYGFSSIQAVISGYLTFLEKGIADDDLEETKQDLKPITKYKGDDSMFIYKVDHDELERKIKTICTEEAKKEDIQKHCITLLQAVKSLPAKYKE